MLISRKNFNWIQNKYGAAARKLGRDTKDKGQT